MRKEINEINIKKQIVLYIIYFVVVLGLTALAIYFTLKDNYKSVLATLKTANISYIFAVIAVVIACILLRSISITLFAKTYLKKYSLIRGIAIDQVGTLYKLVTPAGLGSHFMETVTYKRQGVSISTGLSLIAMYSIVYQAAVIVYGVISISVKHNLINEIGYIPISFTSSSPVSVSLWLLIAIGFTISVLVIGIILLISYWNGFYKFIYGPIYSLLNKIHIIKDIDKQRKRLEMATTNFRNNLTNLFKHWPTLIATFLIFMVYITISYSVPYIVGLSLGNTSNYANIFDSVLLSNIHQMVSTIIPIPGGAIVSEMFFLQLFYPSSGPSFFISEDIARSSLLLWRSLMFIFPLVVSFIFTICYFPRKINYDHQEN